MLEDLAQSIETKTTIETDCFPNIWKQRTKSNKSHHAFTLITPHPQIPGRGRLVRPLEGEATVKLVLAEDP